MMMRPMAYVLERPEIGLSCDGTEPLWVSLQWPLACCGLGRGINRSSFSRLIGGVKMCVSGFRCRLEGEQ